MDSAKKENIKRLVTESPTELLTTQFVEDICNDRDLIDFVASSAIEDPLIIEMMVYAANNDFENSDYIFSRISEETKNSKPSFVSFEEMIAEKTVIPKKVAEFILDNYSFSCEKDKTALYLCCYRIVQAAFAMFDAAEGCNDMLDVWTSLYYVNQAFQAIPDDLKSVMNALTGGTKETYAYPEELSSDMMLVWAQIADLKNARPYVVESVFRNNLLKQVFGKNNAAFLIGEYPKYINDGTYREFPAWAIRDNRETIFKELVSRLDFTDALRVFLKNLYFDTVSIAIEVYVALATGDVDSIDASSLACNYLRRFNADFGSLLPEASKTLLDSVTL